MICNKCNTDKETTDFRPKRRICKQCANKYCRDRYWNNIEVNRKRVRENYKPEAAKIYYAENRDSILQSHREYRNTLTGRVNSMWNSAKSRAKANQLPFDISKDDIRKRLEYGRCERSGIAFDLTSPSNGKMRNKFSASIDKIKPSKGYVTGNIQIVVWCYNTGKGEMTDEEFIEFCKHVARHSHA